MADVDGKHGARLATKYIKIGDIQADILPSDR
jgi:hypothetical protein